MENFNFQKFENKNFLERPFNPFPDDSDEVYFEKLADAIISLLVLITTGELVVVLLMSSSSGQLALETESWLRNHYLYFSVVL